MSLPSPTRFAARIVLPRPALDHAIELAHAIDGEFTPPEVEESLRDDLTIILEHFDHPFTGCWWEEVPLDPADPTLPPPPLPVAATTAPAETAAIPVERGLLHLHQGDTPLEIEVVVEILQAALRKFSLTEAIILEWCGDGAEVGQCWGAAVVITADHIWALNTRAWLAQALADYGLASLSAAAPPLLSPLFGLTPPTRPAPPPAPEPEAEPEPAPAAENTPALQKAHVAATMP